MMPRPPTFNGGRTVRRTAARISTIFEVGHMTDSKRPDSSNKVVDIVSKRIIDNPALPRGAVLIDSVYNRGLGRFETAAEGSRIEGSSIDSEPEEDALRSRSGRQDASTAVIRATFEAATSSGQRRKLRHGQALCVIILVPTPAWATPVSDYYRSVFGDRWVQRVRDASGQSDLQDRYGSSAVSLALSAGKAVVGISADISVLPRTLVSASDSTIRLAPDGAVVRTAIARFAGRAPPDVDDSVVSRLDFDDLVAAFRPGSGPRRIVQRLATAAAALRLRRG